MPDLGFSITSVQPTLYTMAPQLTFKLLITNPSSQSIQSVALRCQIQIETTKRQYSGTEQEGLLDLFGTAGRWGTTLKPLLWTNVNINVPAFDHSIGVDLDVPCSFDFNIATTKYFGGLEGGQIPLNLMFSGTIFLENEEGLLQIEQISWNSETRFQLPVAVWKQMMDLNYPNSTWFCLRRDVFEKLNRYKTINSMPTWEETIETLLRLDQASIEVFDDTSRTIA